MIFVNFYFGTGRVLRIFVNFNFLLVANLETDYWIITLDRGVVDTPLGSRDPYSLAVGTLEVGHRDPLGVVVDIQVVRWVPLQHLMVACHLRADMEVRSLDMAPAVERVNQLGII